MHDVWPSPGLVHYIHFGGSCPLTEFCQVQNSLCIQGTLNPTHSLCIHVLHSPILAALMHSTRAVCVSQTLWCVTVKGTVELSLFTMRLSRSALSHILVLILLLPVRCQCSDFPSVLLCCWLDDRRDICPVENLQLTRKVSV